MMLSLENIDLVSVAKQVIEAAEGETVLVIEESALRDAGELVGFVDELCSLLDIHVKMKIE